MGLPGRERCTISAPSAATASCAFTRRLSDQLRELNDIFLASIEVVAGESSGLRGVEYLVHASRGFSSNSQRRSIVPGIALALLLGL